MVVFFIILFSFPVATAVWWFWAHRRSHTLPKPWIWKACVAVFSLSILFAFGWMFLNRGGRLAEGPPTALLALAYVWFLVVLPIVVLVMILDGARVMASALMKRAIPAGGSGDPGAANQSKPVDAAGGIALTRRGFLAGSAILLPPAAAGGGMIRGLSSLDEFRIRRLVVNVAGLPPSLEGLTIAHLTDTHVGKWTRGKVVDDIVEATNALDADLALFTGDLIDFDLNDLPEAARMLQRVKARLGVYACEGNHDLFQSRDEFAAGLARVGVPLLRNQGVTLRWNGQPVEVLGFSWGVGAQRRNPLLEEHARATLASRDSDAFPIILAHHPHALDFVDVPSLTLAGHTHGGQLMLSEDLGPASLMYKYVSGLYRRGDAALVVSNGVGNWFPLRLGAPAEIVHITLARG